MYNNCHNVNVIPRDVITKPTNVSNIPPIVWDPHPYTHTHTYIPTHTYPHTHTHTHISTHTYPHTYPHTHIRTHIYAQSHHNIAHADKPHNPDGVRQICV